MALLTDMTRDDVIEIKNGDNPPIKIKVMKKSGTKVRIRIDAPEGTEISKTDAISDKS